MRVDDSSSLSFATGMSLAAHVAGDERLQAAWPALGETLRNAWHRHEPAAKPHSAKDAVRQLAARRLRAADAAAFAAEKPPRIAALAAETVAPDLFYRAGYSVDRALSEVLRRRLAWRA